MLRPDPVDILILGYGWTGSFLSPLLTTLKVSHAFTTTAGSDTTIPFKFDPSSSSTAPYQKLPSAKTVIIVFPLTGTGQSTHLVNLYRQVHGERAGFIQLGSSGIFNQVPHGWSDRHSPYDSNNSRAIAEDELMRECGGAVLNLSGLYGGPRDPKHWLPRIAKSKAEIASKKAVHLVHGEDVARAIYASHRAFEKIKGQRWIVSDLRVYDWYDLIMSWSGEFDRGFARVENEVVKGEEEEELNEDTKLRLKMGKWVGELMVENEIRGLPREGEVLGRLIDSREFWSAVGVWPKHVRLN